ncbi:MAG: tRNA-(ms[2]io[6]A)-hydroxylase [Gammaproteobacteria bacterium]
MKRTNPLHPVDTTAAWFDAVTENIDGFLVDHAACERKASAMAVSMICHYPDRDALIGPMSDLAVEEMAHYRDVLKLLRQRGASLGKDAKDPYVNDLRAAMRRGRQPFFQDQLLVAGLIEARGAERFAVLAAQLPDAGLRRFYERFATSEERHWQLFLDLADEYFAPEENAKRLLELRDIEATIIAQLPPRAALH